MEGFLNSLRLAVDLLVSVQLSAYCLSWLFYEHCYLEFCELKLIGILVAKVIAPIGNAHREKSKSHLNCGKDISVALQPTSCTRKMQAVCYLPTCCL